MVEYEPIYAAPPGEAWFWQLQDGEQAVAWLDGATLAFRPEIELILDRFRDVDFPPIDSILLLLAALRDNWTQPPARAGLLMGLMAAIGADDALPLLRAVSFELDRVHGIAVALREEKGAAAEMMRIVYEKNVELGRALPFRSADNLPIDADAVLVPPPPNQFAHTLRFSLGYLQRGLPSVTESAVRLRLRTGLEQLPAPADIKLPPAEGVRQLLRQLENNAETSGPARLAQSVLAMLQIPSGSDHAADTFIGGINDIAPRGPLDRLLLSELSHDDLTLSVRIALGEALYLRREMPPRPRPRERRVLLDIGLRMWGIPRVYAIAVGMALAALNEPNLATNLFTSAGDAIAPARIDKAESLIELLSRLDTHAHFGGGLELLNAARDRSPAAAEQELVLVTCRDAWADPEFQRQLAAAALGEYFVIQVERDGELTIARHTPAGQSILKHARLDVANILKPSLARRPTKAALCDRSREEVLPAIFQMGSFPLRLSYPVHEAHSWCVGGRYVYTLAADGRLLLWTDPNFAASQLADGLRQGRMICCRELVDGSVTIIAGSMSARGMQEIRLDGAYDFVALRRLDLGPITHPSSVEIHNSVALVFDRTKVAAVSLATGEFLGSTQVGHPRRQFGRFVQASGQEHRWEAAWQAYFWDGQRVAAETVPVPSWRESEPSKPFAESEPTRPQTERVIAVFTAEGFTEPTIVFEDGAIFHSNQFVPTPWRKALKPPLTFHQISRDGRHFLISDNARTYYVVAWQGPSPTIVPAAAFNDWAGLRKYSRSINYLKRSNWLCVDQGVLWLTSGNGRLHLINNDLHLASPDIHHSDAAKKHAWTPVQHPSLGGIRLSKVRFDDGSTVYFDSRGLLHFRSSDQQIPEFTIITAPGWSAGWNALGKVWGATYFLGPRFTGDARGHAAGPASEMISLSEARDLLYRPFLERLA